MKKIKMEDFIFNLLLSSMRRRTYLSYVLKAAHYVKKRIYENNLEIKLYDSVESIISAVNNSRLYKFDVNTQNIELKVEKENMYSHPIDDNILQFIKEFNKENNDIMTIYKINYSYLRKCENFVRKEAYMKWLYNYILLNGYMSSDRCLINENARNIKKICMLKIFCNMVVDFIKENILMFEKEIYDSAYEYNYYFKYEGVKFLIIFNNSSSYYFIKIVPYENDEKLIAKYEDVIKGVELESTPKRKELIETFKNSLTEEILEEIPKEHLVKALESLYFFKEKFI